MKLPKVAGGVRRFGGGHAAEEYAGILPSNNDWSCKVCHKIGSSKICFTDPVCVATRPGCTMNCQNACRALPEGSHARKVCESKC